MNEEESPCGLAAGRRRNPSAVGVHEVESARAAVQWNAASAWAENDRALPFPRRFGQHLQAAAHGQREGVGAIVVLAARGPERAAVDAGQLCERAE